MKFVVQSKGIEVSDHLHDYIEKSEISAKISKQNELQQVRNSNVLV